MIKEQNLLEKDKVVFDSLRLNDVRKAVVEILEERTGKKWVVDIHLTTGLNQVNANVQGFVSSHRGEVDILVSGELEFAKLFKAVAHEVVHLLYPDLQEEDQEFPKKVEQLEQEIKQKIRRW